MVRSGGLSIVLFATLMVALHFLLRVGFGLGRAAPDLLTVTVLLAGRRMNGPPAALLGVVLGVIEDATGLHALGARAIGLGAAGYGASRSRRSLTGEGLGFTPLFLFAGTLLSLLVTWLFRRPGMGSTADLLFGLPLEAAYAAVVGSLAARLLPRRGRTEL